MFKARDFMVSNPVTVKPDITVYEAAKIMSQHGISSLVVVDDAQRVLGIVTAKDIIAQVVAKGLNPREVRVKDIMSSPVTITSPEAPLTEVVEIMARTGHGHIPVVDENGRVIGMVAEIDILKILPTLFETLALRKG